MPHMMSVGPGGAVDIERIAVVAPFRSKPIKRLLMTVGPERVLNLTYGYAHEAVILLDNGTLLVVSMPVHELLQALRLAQEEAHARFHP